MCFYFTPLESRQTAKADNTTETRMKRASLSEIHVYGKIAVLFLFSFNIFQAKNASSAVKKNYDRINGEMTIKEH